MSDLFGAGPKPEAKPRRVRGKAPAAAIPDAPAIPKLAKGFTAEDYEQDFLAMLEAVATAEDAKKARTAWLQQEPVRRAIGMELRQERMLKAAMDGRCNRIIAGVIPAGRD